MAKSTVLEARKQFTARKIGDEIHIDFERQLGEQYRIDKLGALIYKLGIWTGWLVSGPLFANFMLSLGSDIGGASLWLMGWLLHIAIGVFMIWIGMKLSKNKNTQVRINDDFIHTADGVALRREHITSIEWKLDERYLPVNAVQSAAQARKIAKDLANKTWRVAALYGHNEVNIIGPSLSPHAAAEIGEFIGSMLFDNKDVDADDELPELA
jgi:hypothetical protein